MNEANLYRAATMISSGEAEHALPGLVEAANTGNGGYKVYYVLALAYQECGLSAKAHAAWCKAAEHLAEEAGHRPLPPATHRFMPAATREHAQSATSEEALNSESGQLTPATGEDLYDLISELESGSCFPERTDLWSLESGSDDDLDGLVTETLARIHAAQGLYQEAAEVYEQLAVLHPDEAFRYQALAAAMGSRVSADDEASAD